MLTDRPQGGSVDAPLRERMDPLGIIFPQDVNFFLNHPPAPVMTVIEGAPGVGKTLLTLRIAAEVARGGGAADQFVLFIAMEQKLKSLERLAEQFMDADMLAGTRFHQGACGKDDVGLGNMADGAKLRGASIVVFKPTDGDSDAGVPLSTSNFIPFLRRLVHATQALTQRECRLVIVDNANVIRSSKEAMDIAGECGHGAHEATPTGTADVTSERTCGSPLSRAFLRRLYDNLKLHTQSMILVVEGHPERVQPHIDFFADVVIRMSHEGEGVARRAVLQVKKSRNRETSPGVHTITIESKGLTLWPSPESILRVHAEAKLRYLGSGAKRAGLTVKHGINGWATEFDGVDVTRQPKAGEHPAEADSAVAVKEPRTLLRERDIVVIAGPPNSGKSQLLHALMWAEPPDGVATACRDKVGGSRSTCEPRLGADLGDASADAPINASVNECGKCREAPALIVWHKPVAAREGGFQTVLVPSEPFWDRNQLFFALYRSLLPLAERRSVIGIENLTVMLAAFPLVTHDATFIPAFFDLLRGLGLTAFIEMTVGPESVRDAISAPQRQAQELADVLIQIDEATSTEGRILTLDVSAASARTIPSRKRVRWSPELRTVSSEETDAYYETFDHGMKILSRKEVVLALPVWTPSEREHASVLQVVASAAVGAANVSLVPIVSASIVPPEERNIDGARPPKPRREVFNRYALDEVIRRRALYNRNALTLMVCGDDVLESDEWRQPLPGIGCSAREHYLEPLGTVEEWYDILGVKSKDDLLVDFLTDDSKTKVIGVPYTIDTEVLAWRTEVCRAAQCCLTDEEATMHRVLEKVSLEGLVDFVDAIRLCVDRSRKNKLVARRCWRMGAFDPKMKPEDAEALTSQYVKEVKGLTAPFEMLGYGRETCIVLAADYLLNVGDLAVKNTFNTSENVRAIERLRTIVTRKSINVNPERTNTRAGIWVGWYSRLSALGVTSFPDLAHQGMRIDAAGHKHWLCAVHHFVVPKGSGSARLARSLLAGFCKRDFALERARRFVGLSPFKHAARELAFLPPTVRTVLLDRSAFEARCLKRHTLFANYGQQAAIVGERLQTALLAKHPEGSDVTESDLIRDCLRTLDEVRCVR